MRTTQEAPVNLASSTQSESQELNHVILTQKAVAYLDIFGYLVIVDDGYGSQNIEKFMLNSLKFFMDVQKIDLKFLSEENIIRAEYTIKNPYGHDQARHMDLLVEKSKHAEDLIAFFKNLESMKNSKGKAFVM